MLKVHHTARYHRIRILNPRKFYSKSFKTKDIGRKGWSKIIIGIHRDINKWVVQAILVSRKESLSMKYQLQEHSKYLQKRYTEMGLS